MTDDNQMLKEARAALEADTTIDLHAHPIDFSVEDGAVVMAGEVADIAAKRRAWHLVTDRLGADRLKDRLRVMAGEPRGDGAIADDLTRALAGERALQDYAIGVESGSPPPGRAAAETPGEVRATVEDATITLDGEVESLMHKRLADVVAWWTPGVTRVDNHLRVNPPEEDSDDEITDALRTVLEKDPSLEAGQIAVRVNDRCVTLEGQVSGEEQKRLATLDAWFVLGVHAVDNRLHVADTGP